MFWSKHRITSVRTRLIICYLLHTVLAYLSLTAAVLFLTWQHDIRVINERLDTLIDELRYEYMTGHEGNGGTLDTTLKTVPIQNLPSIPFQTFKFQDGSYVCIITNAQNSCDEYVLTSDGRIADVRTCRMGDITFLTHIFEEKSFDLGAANSILLLTAPDGKVLARTRFDDRLLSGMQSPKRQRRLYYRLHRRLGVKKEHATTLRVATAKFPDGNTLSVGQDVTQNELFLIQLAIYFSIGFIFALLGGAFAANNLARRFVHSLEAVTHTARQIEKGDLSRRVKGPFEGYEIARLAEAFNRMCAANEKSLTELRILSDNIAHDLRTPLTRMRGVAEIASENGTPDERSLATTVADESAAMLDMINMMLEISQTDCKIERTPREQLDLTQFVRNAAELYSAIAEDNGIKLSISAPETPVWFNGHRGKLQQILGNLLDNAIKFTPHGGMIDITLAQKDDGGIELNVTDTGRGITPDDLPHVFNRFWRADSSRSLPGNGLGLALVRAIVTSYGGNVFCTSTEGKGSTFTVRLS